MGQLSPSEASAYRRGPLPQTGVRRAVPPHAFPRPAISTSSDGRAVLAVSLTSPGASRIRLHFRDFNAGSGEVWVYAPGDETTADVYSGQGIFGNGDFWSAGVNAATVAVAYVAPPGITLANLPYTIDSLSHQWAGFASAGAAAGCNLDVACYPDYKTVATGIVEYDFVDDTGAARSCSGSMINTQKSSFIPYLLTAHHCISSDSEARSIQAYFLYQAPACNGTPPPLWSVPTILGGTYLAGAGYADGDYALVQLTGAPGGVAFLGWNASPLDPAASVTGIHHPQGSYKRISFGKRTADIDTSISGEIAPASRYYAVSWTSGVVESGSSGSPLLDGNRQIAGTLTSGPVIPAGSTICDIKANGTYGRFSNAYAAIRPYLEDSILPMTGTPSSLKFQVTDGVVAAPAQQSVLITTQSGSPVAFTARGNQGWLTVPSGGTASASSPATLAIAIDPALLTEPGTYYGLVSLNSSSAGPVSISIQVDVSLTHLPVSLVVTPNPVFQQVPDANGNQWSCTLRLTETAGVAGKITGFKIDSADYSSQLQNVFGGASLPKLGTVLASYSVKSMRTPAVVRFEVDGEEVGSGRAWQVVQHVPFLGTNSAPSISMVASAAGGQTGSVPGAYLSIYGTNLAARTGDWSGAIVNGHLPTQLEGVSVNVGGKPASVYFVSPEQINVVAPDVAPGPVEVQVTSFGGASAPFPTMSQQHGPALFLWNGKYAVATRPDYSLAAPSGLFPGLATIPAKPGDVIVLWGTGFGPVSPAAPSGMLTPLDKLYSTANTVTVTLGGTNAPVYGAALAPGYAGLYQIAIQVPNSAPDGDIPVKVSIGGVPSPDNVFLTVHR